MTKPDPSFAETEAGRMTEDEASSGLVEQRKAIFEFLRHLMTLDSAALVLIVTLIEKVFAAPGYRLAVGLAVGAFLVSLLGGGFTYLILLASYPRIGALRMTSSDRRDYLWAMQFTFLGFLVGMMALAWFFAGNWFHW